MTLKANTAGKKAGASAPVKPTKEKGAYLADGDVLAHLIAKSKVDFAIQALFDELKRIYPLHHAAKLSGYSFSHDGVVLTLSDQSKHVLPRAVLEAKATDRLSALLSYVEKDMENRRRSAINDLNRRRIQLERELDGVVKEITGSARPDNAVSLENLDNTFQGMLNRVTLFEPRRDNFGIHAPLAQHICDAISTGEDVPVMLEYRGAQYPFALTPEEALRITRIFATEASVYSRERYLKYHADRAAQEAILAKDIRENRAELVSAERALSASENASIQVKEKLLRERNHRLDVRQNLREAANQARLERRLIKLWNIKIRKAA